VIKQETRLPNPKRREKKKKKKVTSSGTVGL
jgi:hypothetical protein